MTVYKNIEYSSGAVFKHFFNKGHGILYQNEKL